MWIYCIVPTDSVTDEMLEMSAHDSLGGCRKSLDGRLTILKFEVPDLTQVPVCVQKRTLLTQAEALQETSTTEWCRPIDDLEPMAKATPPPVLRRRLAIGIAGAAAAAAAFAHFALHWF